MFTLDDFGPSEHRYFDHNEDGCIVCDLTDSMCSWCTQSGCGDAEAETHAYKEDRL